MFNLNNFVHIHFLELHSTMYALTTYAHTNAGLGSNPGWETPFSPCLGLKASPLVLVPSTRIDLRLLVPVGNTNR